MNQFYKTLKPSKEEGNKRKNRKQKNAVAYNNKDVSITDNFSFTNEVIFHFQNAVFNRTLLTISLAPGYSTIITSASIYPCYFFHLLNYQKRYEFSDYVRSAKLKKLISGSSLTFETFRTAKSRFLRFFSNHENKSIQNIGEILRRTINISKNGKEKFIEFLKTSLIRIKVTRG